jgi:hypothetical protein
VNYRIDASDVLIHVGPRAELDRYADAPAVPHLPERWFGEVIWPWIPDDEVRAVLVALVARARAGHAVALTTRCGSPTVPRVVAMEIVPLGGGAVEFRCRLGGPLATRGPAGHRGPLRICAWCHRADRGGWREIDEVVVSERLFELPHVPVVTHGICDTCLAKVTAPLDAAAARE